MLKANLPNMLKLKKVIIYSGAKELSEWVQLTMSLSSLEVNEYLLTAKITDISEQPCSLIIATEEKFKQLHKHFNNQTCSPPILIMTKEFTNLNIPKSSRLTIDSLPLPATTIGLLEHSIRAVVHDFRMNQKLTKLAHYDALTGAANRLLFNDRLAQALKTSKRSKHPVSLLYFDLDEFKEINDTYGHDVGDELLILFTKIVSSCSRESDTVARLGGDEFVLLLPDTSHSDLHLICKHIISALTGLQSIKDYTIEIKCSIGAVTSPTNDNEYLSAESLLKKADEKVYIAKNLVGTNVVGLL